MRIAGSEGEEQGAHEAKMQEAARSEMGQQSRSVVSSQPGLVGGLTDRAQRRNRPPKPQSYFESTTSEIASNVLSRIHHREAENIRPGMSLACGQGRAGQQRSRFRWQRSTTKADIPLQVNDIQDYIQRQRPCQGDMSAPESKSPSVIASAMAGGEIRIDCRFHVFLLWHPTKLLKTLARCPKSDRTIPNSDSTK